MPQSNKARASQPAEPTHSRAHKPQLWSPRAAITEARTPRARAPQQEKSSQREACIPE